MKTKVKIANMKNTLANKINLIISLWLAVIIGVTTIIGYQTEIREFYIASLVLAIILLALNALFLSLYIRKAWRIQPSQQENFNR